MDLNIPHPGCSGCPDPGLYDLQSTAIQKVLCLCLGVSFDIHQVIDNLLVSSSSKYVKYVLLKTALNLCRLNAGV